MATQEDKRALEDQMRALTERLDRRKVQKYRYGVSADPIIDSEINDLEFSIATIKRQLDDPQLLPEARAAMERYAADNLAFALSSIRDLTQRHTQTEERVGVIATMQHQDHLEVLSMRDTLQLLANDMQDNQTQAERGRRRNLYLQIAGLMLLGFLALALWLVLSRGV